MKASIHNDEGHHREEIFVVLHLVNLKDDEALRQEINILIRVQQEFIAPSSVVLLKCCKEVIDIEVGERDLYLPLLHILSIYISQVLIEGIEAGHNTTISPQKLDIGIDRRAQFAGLRLSNPLLRRIPEGKQERTDALALLYIEDIIIGVEWIEGEGALIRVSEVPLIIPYFQNRSATKHSFFHRL